MKPVDFTRPREAARAFTPKLSDFVEQPLYSDVWTDLDLAPRDRSLMTIACLIALNHSSELPTHLRRGLGSRWSECCTAISRLSAR